MAVEERERSAGGGAREAVMLLPPLADAMQERVGAGVWQLIGMLAWRRQQNVDEVEGKRGARSGGRVTLSGGGGSGRCWIWIRWLGKVG